MTRESTTDNVLSVFFVCCSVFGCGIGVIGLGIGLLCLTVSQAVGLALLSGGCGAFFGGFFGGKMLLRTILDTMREQDRKAAEEKHSRAPVTREPQSESVFGSSR